ncbi:MAG: protein-disulfide reductase DsbD domain-containing protein, partial [Porticoccus sp.]
MSNTQRPIQSKLSEEHLTRSTMPSRLINSFLYCLLLLVQPIHAEDLFPSSYSANPLEEIAQFLPVEDAYRLVPTIDGDQLLVNWEIEPGYYLYQHRFRFLNSDLTPLSATPEFEPGKRIYDEYYEKDLEVYYHHTLIRLPLDANYTELIVESQGCADAGLCYPPRRQTITLDPASSIATVTETANHNLRSGTDAQPPLAAGNLLLMMLFALLGGIILNLMPCVFPVLSIKALSLTTTHLSKHGKHLHGFAYTLGIVFSFMAIAALLMMLRRAGEGIGWGFQLQSPIFVGLLVYLFVLMGLSFSGVFTMGTRLMNIGQSTTEGHSLSSSFMTGMLATVVASPCTAPFMGTALGFALAQPTWVAMSVFTSLGLGMALPLLLLSWWPGMAEKMPRPGAWMERFKEFLAFPLYLTAVWLLWVLGRQTSSDTVAALIIGVVLILFALWTLKIRKSPLTIIIALIATALALILPWQTHTNKDNSNTFWEPYSETKLQLLRAKGEPVFVNMTADWCITCLANEKLALSSDRFLTMLQQEEITYLKGDWTN